MFGFLNIDGLLTKVKICTFPINIWSCCFWKTQQTFDYSKSTIETQQV